MNGQCNRKMISYLWVVVPVVVETLFNATVLWEELLHGKVCTTW